MKLKILTIVLAVLVLFMGCSYSGNEENSFKLPEQSAPENPTPSEVTVPEKEPLFISVEKDIDLWNDYCSEYSVFFSEWVTDKYFFVLLEHKEAKEYKLIFYDTDAKDIIDIGNLGLSLSDFDFHYIKKTFMRGNTYYIIQPDKLIKISLDTFKISYEDTEITDFWEGKNLINDIFISPFGIVAELKDRYTILLYDILTPQETTVIDTSDIIREGIQLNQGIDWSFNGKYFLITHTINGEYIADDSCYSVFSSEGKFIRYAYGNVGSWGEDSLWLHHWAESEEDWDKWDICSLSKSETKPMEVHNQIPVGCDFEQRNNFHFEARTDKDKAKTEFIKIDLLNGNSEIYAESDCTMFNYFYYSSTGKYTAYLSYDHGNGSFFFTFLDTEN